MYFVKEGENEWVKIKCICVLIIFILSGINCKYICLYDLVINLKKKLKRKIKICILVLLWLLVDIFY